MICSMSYNLKVIQKGKEVIKDHEDINYILIAIFSVKHLERSRELNKNGVKIIFIKEDKRMWIKQLNKKLNKIIIN